jgi:hypothetical protein
MGHGVFNQQKQHNYASGPSPTVAGSGTEHAFTATYAMGRLGAGGGGHAFMAMYALLRLAGGNGHMASAVCIKRFSGGQALSAAFLCDSKNESNRASSSDRLGARVVADARRREDAVSTGVCADNGLAL